jgi:hypothetical protein
MRLARRLAVACLSLSLGLACGGDGGSPIVPSSIAIVEGNNQSALPGESLAVRLRVSVTGSNSQPLSGAAVAWSVAAGSAALAQASTNTDVNGVATNKVTMGVNAGPISINATVTGVAPATFTATALDPCDIPQAAVPHTIGSTVNAALTSFDCRFAGPFFTDFYRVTLPAQQSFNITQHAVFDTYMEFYHTSGPFIAINDDQQPGVNTDARISVIAAAGAYFIVASSFDSVTTGAYGLITATTPEALTGCPTDEILPWLTRGVALSQQLQAADCAIGRTGGGTAFSDRALIALSPTRGLNATLASGVYNPRIELYQLSGVTSPTLVGSADGPAGSAVLAYAPASATHLFRLELTSMDTAKTGGYTLNITGPAPAEASILPLGAIMDLRARRAAVRRGKQR